MSVGHLPVLFGKNVYPGLLLILKQVVCLILRCICSLYILDINPLSDMLFANVFSHSVSGFFILWIVSFAVQKLFSLIRSHLFTFAFVSLA